MAVRWEAKGKMEAENNRKSEFLPYKIVCGSGYGEYEEKKSRFLAQIAPASSVEEAMAFVESIRKKYYDARHHCFAYVIGRNKEATRYSDDGEPGGTAGKPILEVLLGNDVTDVVAVVTRYFGGTLLGTGGLVRAYTQAVREGIAGVQTVRMCYGTEMTVRIGYGDAGRLQHLFEIRNVTVRSSRYTEKIEYDVRVPDEKCGEIQRAIIETTAGRAGITVTGQGYYKEQI